MSARVAIVGAGMAGAACARELLAAGVEPTVFDRGRAPGGRMAAPRVHDRRTDLGAAYFTVTDDDFGTLVGDWTTRSLVREWTDTFAVITGHDRTSTTGPMRYAAPGGLRSVVRDLLADLPVVELNHRLDSLGELGHEYDAVVLAMPDAQANRLAPGAADWVDYEPVISVAVGWDARRWDPFDAAFVNDSSEITLVADDGARRGDDAPVLVAHSTAERAWEHLDDPQAAARPVLRAMQRALDIAYDPDWTHCHRWTFAKPAGTHGNAPFGLIDYRGRPLGLCTDSWCPSGSPRVESAWLSGRALGRTLGGRLAQPGGIAGRR